jgi:hypothetical protein
VGTRPGEDAPIRWAHLDIATPAFNTGAAYGYTPVGGTGVSVRTLLGLIEDIAANGAGSRALGDAGVTVHHG